MDAQYEVPPTPSESKHNSKLHILFATVALFIIFSVMAVVYQYTATRNIGVSIEDTQTKTEGRSEEYQTDPVLQEETLEATLLEVAVDGSYLRMGVPAKGAYSFEVTKDTIVTAYDGSFVDIKTFPPLTKVVITAVQLVGTAPYDMRAIKITRALPPDKEHEENRNIMSEMHLDQMQ